MDWQGIVAIVFGVVVIVLGVRWQNLKALVKEGGELITAVSDAIADDKITKEEIANIMKEGNDVVVAFKKLIGK